MAELWWLWNSAATCNSRIFVRPFASDLEHLKRWCGDFRHPQLGSLSLAICSMSSLQPWKAGSVPGHVHDICCYPLDLRVVLPRIPKSSPIKCLALGRLAGLPMALLNFTDIQRTFSEGRNGKHEW